MSNTLDIFSQACEQNNGYLLASTLDPSKKALFNSFVRASTSTSITTDVRYATTYNNSLGLSKSESSAWLDLYVALWKAGYAILAADYRDQNGGVNSSDGQWLKVYDAWKDVNSALIAGYQKAGFAAWTTPALYMTAKWLRLYAIRADEQARYTKDEGNAGFSQGLNDDLTDDTSGQEKLEDAARQINRVFSLCISDRSPMDDSRKWGLYYITNLLFKTYFKVTHRAFRCCGISR